MKWSLERYFLSLFQTWSYTMQRHFRILKKPLHWLMYEVPQLFSWTDRTEETLTAPFKYLSSDTKVREAFLETMKPSSDLTIPGIVFFVFVSFRNDKSVRILEDPIVIFVQAWITSAWYLIIMLFSGQALVCLLPLPLLMELGVLTHSFYRFKKVMRHFILSVKEKGSGLFFVIPGPSVKGFNGIEDDLKRDPVLSVQRITHT